MQNNPTQKDIKLLNDLKSKYPLVKKLSRNESFDSVSHGNFPRDDEERSLAKVLMEGLEYIFNKYNVTKEDETKTGLSLWAVFHNSAKFRPVKFDHTRMWRTKCGGLLVLTAPYHPKKSDFVSRGFTLEPAFYAKNTPTFAKHYSSLDEVKAEIKDAGGRL